MDTFVRPLRDLNVLSITRDTRLIQYSTQVCTTPFAQKNASQLRGI